MNLEEFNKKFNLINKCIKDEMTLNNSSYAFTKDKIIQDDAISNHTKNSKKSSSLMKNGKFQDDYSDFTEFEDESGNIRLIKYSDVEYEFRGNKYCKYILCDEKTGYREDGIAQIWKDREPKYVHIEDDERLIKIREYIEYTKSVVIKKYCNGKNFENYHDGYGWICIGYVEEPTLQDKITIIFKQKNSKAWRKWVIPYSGYLGSNITIINDKYQEYINSPNFVMLNSIDDNDINDNTVDNGNNKTNTIIHNKNKNWYYIPICVILILIYLTLLIGTLGYAFIQFEFCTNIRPEFIDTWIKTIDKSFLPLIFHDNQKHPIVLFLLWLTSIYWGIKAIVSLEYFLSNSTFLAKLKDILFENKKQIILGIIFLFLMSKAYVYQVLTIYFIVEIILFYIRIYRNNQ